MLYAFPKVEHSAKFVQTTRVVCTDFAECCRIGRDLNILPSHTFIFQQLKEVKFMKLTFHKSTFYNQA